MRTDSLFAVDLPRRGYTYAEVEALASVAGVDPGAILAAAPFSPGPWWGFNGVQTLVLTWDSLHVVQSGIALTTGRLRRSARLDSISGTRARVVGGGRVVRLTLRVKGRRRTHTSMFREGVSFCERLEASLTDV